jgi:MoxR-like ATPase
VSAREAEVAAVERDAAEAREVFERLRVEVGRRFLGHAAVVEDLLLAILAGGHVLLEGAPGLGKTTLVRALAGALDLEFRRVQFTPDLVPADVLGARLLEEQDGRRVFRFEKGPIFTHVLLADEVNRATPRTQAALLEAMQERQVTAFGERFPLEEPFLVVATQNPIEMEGTYPLPEAQLDRFLLRLDLGAPSEDELVAILAHASGEPAPEPAPVVGRTRLVELAGRVRAVVASSDALRLAARLVRATHPADPLAPESVRRAVRHGASPRGGQALLLAAKARALVRGRLHVAREDLEALARPALRHRLILSFEGEAEGARPDALVEAALEAARRTR